MPCSSAVFRAKEGVGLERGLNRFIGWKSRCQNRKTGSNCYSMFYSRMHRVRGPAAIRTNTQGSVL